ncbi:uncharacterized protein BJ171DRAFT_484671 [Polychytrium aggregatum]|uniref:uncharacterized protein n=1 Tax=Polychytrium aggregatum TaxID=110093 RepID=UPI0022FEF05A|nr:uncharacterized protein BJ171DRAFT_484671 [Polychytrium aggregatum]KAI9209667.1 hypothetical protein BJ171DRAFT_484671 [Polychytrium aggregatum]
MVSRYQPMNQSIELRLYLSPSLTKIKIEENTDANSSGQLLDYCFDGKLDFFRLQIGSVSLLRRCHDNAVSAAAMFQIIPRHLLSLEYISLIQARHNRDYSSLDHEHPRDTAPIWIPLDVARELAVECQIDHRIAPLLHDFPRLASTKAITIDRFADEVACIAALTEICKQLRSSSPSIKLMRVAKKSLVRTRIDNKDYAILPLFHEIYGGWLVARRLSDGCVNIHHLMRLVGYPFLPCHKYFTVGASKKNVRTGSWFPPTHAIELASIFGLFDIIVDLVKLRQSAFETLPEIESILDWGDLFHSCEGSEVATFVEMIDEPPPALDSSDVYMNRYSNTFVIDPTRTDPPISCPGVWYCNYDSSGRKQKTVILFHINNVAIIRKLADGLFLAERIMEAAGIGVIERRQRAIQLRKVRPNDAKAGMHIELRFLSGTWVTKELAYSLAIEYGLESAMQPIFEFDPTIHRAPVCHAEGRILAPALAELDVVWRPLNFLLLPTEFLRFGPISGDVCAYPEPHITVISLPRSLRSRTGPEDCRPLVVTLDRKLERWKIQHGSWQVTSESFKAPLSLRMANEQQDIQPDPTAEQPPVDLPTSDFVDFLHSQASQKYGRYELDAPDVPSMFETLDETALVGLGILLQEVIRDQLPETLAVSN